MNVRIFYRSATVWNIILFILLAFFFLYFQEGLLGARSVFEKSFLKRFLWEYAPVHGLILVSSISVFLLKKASRPLFIFTSLVVIGATLKNLYGDFSKLIIIALFLYTLITYYFYQFLSIEVAESYYNPLYNEDDLFAPMLKRLECEIKDAKGNTMSGWMTNWNENGCFVYLGDQEMTLQGKSYDVILALAERPFMAKASVASKSADGKGIGLKLENKAHDEFSWKDYHSIVDQMGYSVEYLK